MKPLLEVRELRKHFPVGRRSLSGRPRSWLRAVDGVSFDLHPGEALGLVGCRRLGHRAGHDARGCRGANMG